MSGRARTCSARQTPGWAPRRRSIWLHRIERSCPCALSRRATLAGISGRIDDAIELADAALKLGLQIGIPDARGCFSTLRGSLAAFGSSMPTIEDVLPDTDPMWPVFPLLRAWTMVSH